MTAVRLCLLLPLVAGGCTRTHELALPPAPDARALEVIEREGRRGPAQVTTAEGVVTAERIAVAAPQLTLQTGEGPPYAVPLADVRRIEFRSARRGALEGMGLGLVAGLAAGAILGLSTDSWLPGNADVAVGMWWASLVAVPAGFVVGVVRGHRTRVRVGPGL